MHNKTRAMTTSYINQDDHLIDSDHELSQLDPKTTSPLSSWTEKNGNSGSRKCQDYVYAKWEH